MEHIVALFYIFYILTNHSFNKIGILMNKDLDKELQLAEGSSFITLITSSILAACGKIFGSFIEITSIRYALCLLFLLNGIFMYLALNTNDMIVYFWARNLQGLVSGFQTSIIIGFISLLKNNKVGFANFTGVSALASLGISILIQCYTINNISYLLVILSIIPTFLFWFLLKNVPQTYKTIPIISRNIWKALKNIKFLLYAIILGTLLGTALVITQKQTELISRMFPDYKDYRFIITSLAFVLSSFVSFLYKIQRRTYGLLTILLGLLSFFIGIKYKLLGFASFGCISGFVSFAIVSPVICSNVTKLVDDKFVNSSLFFGIRSGITALAIYSCGLLNNWFPLSITIYICLGLIMLCHGLLIFIKLYEDFRD
jgi:hypothetical protein